MYIDDYAILDTSYLVHAIPIDPCEEQGDRTYRIGLILHVANHSYPGCQEYPTKQLRDAAFEAICALVQREARERATEDEEEYDA